LLVEYNTQVVRPTSMVDCWSCLSGIPLMCQHRFQTYMSVDYLNFVDCRYFYKVYFAEHSASDIPQVTCIWNSTFRKIH